MGWIWFKILMVNDGTGPIGGLFQGIGLHRVGQLNSKDLPIYHSCASGMCPLSIL